MAQGPPPRRTGSARPDAEERHQLRLDVKKLRYAAEFLAGLWAKKPQPAQRDRFIAALKDLQDRLGDLNDAEAAETLTAGWPRPARQRRPDQAARAGRGRDLPPQDALARPGRRRLLALADA